MHLLQVSAKTMVGTQRRGTRTEKLSSTRTTLEVRIGSAARRSPAGSSLVSQSCLSPKRRQNRRCAEPSVPSSERSRAEPRRGREPLAHRPHAPRQGRVIFASSCPGVLAAGASIRLAPERPAGWSRRGASPLSAAELAAAARGGPSPSGVSGPRAASRRPRAERGTVWMHIPGSSGGGEIERRIKRQRDRE